MFTDNGVVYDQYELPWGCVRSVCGIMFTDHGVVNDQYELSWGCVRSV